MTGRYPLSVIIATVLFATFAVACSAEPIFLKSATIHPGAVTTQDTGIPSSGPYILVQFSRAVTSVERQTIAACGGHVLSYIPVNTMLVRADAAAAGRLRKAKDVEWVGPYLPVYRVSPSVGGGREPQRFNVLCFPDADTAAVVAAIKSRKAAIEALSGTAAGSLIALSAPPAVARTLGEIPGVRWVEPRLEPQLANDVARAILNVPQVWEPTGLYGEGQIVAVADTGLDVGVDNPLLHEDFKGRLAAGFGLGRTGLTNDIHGHGTHVSGSVLGSGLLSGSDPAVHQYEGSYAGVAPEASLVIQSLIDASGALAGIPSDLGNLFAPPYEVGARIHTNSWGADARGIYDLMARQLDQFTWDHKDMLIFFSAGNGARDSNSDGVTDSDSMSAPATAKNCVSVGATESVRLSGGMQATWSAGDWGSLFPVEPISTDPISNNAQGLAAWSARGPCDDGRIKPDIVAPGTNILSTRSRDPLAGNGWGGFNSDYMFSGGTSMATPIAAGAAALVRQYYTDIISVNPSAALIKATLMCSAKDIAPGQYGTGAFQEIGQRPDNAQGWGRLDLKQAIEPAPPVLRQHVDEQTGLTTGQIRTFSFKVIDTSVPLRVLLTWTDFPGDIASARALVNDLDLTVQAPNGTIYPGNGSPDRINNVESVDVAAPVLGVYKVSVSGYNIPEGPQPFALVVEGGLPRAYVSGRVTTPGGSGIPGTTLTAVSVSEHFSATTDEDGVYAINLTPGQYSISASNPGWAFSPSSVSRTVNDTGVKDVNFLGTAPSATLAGTVSLGRTVSSTGQWDSPHPYENSVVHSANIKGPANAVRMRVHFQEMDSENGFDFISVSGISGAAVATYTGPASHVWSPWVDGNAVRVVITPDSSQAYFGWRIDRYEAIVPGEAMEGAAVSDSRSGRTVWSKPAGEYSIPGVEPLRTTLAASVPGYVTKPAMREVKPLPGQILTQQDFVAVPEPPVIHLGISHSYPADIVVRVGIGTPENPLWSQTVLNRSSSAATKITLDVPADEALQYFPPSVDNPWFVTVCDEARYDGGAITAFSISRGADTYYAADLPALIADFQCTTVKIPSEPPRRIGDVKQMMDGLPVEMWQKVVTARFDDRIYIQEPDTSAAICIYGSINVEPGDIVSVKGYTDRNGCERVITSPQVFVDKKGATVKPLNMAGRSLGGRPQGIFSPGFEDADGLNNIGMLVSLTGRVTKVGPGFIYVSDGTEASDMSGSRGIRVSAVGLTLPDAGDLVRVTGISGCKDLGYGDSRIIYVRADTDIVVLEPYTPIFTDSFETGAPGWTAFPGMFPMLPNNSRAHIGRLSFLSREDATEASYYDLPRTSSTNFGVSAWLYDDGTSVPQSQMLELRGQGVKLDEILAVGVHTPVSSYTYCIYSAADGWVATGVPRKAGWVKLGIRVYSYTGGLDDVRFLMNDAEIGIGRRNGNTGISRILLGNRHLFPSAPGFWDDISFGYGE